MKNGNPKGAKKNAAPISIPIMIALNGNRMVVDFGEDVCLVRRRTDIDFTLTTTTFF